MGRKRKHEREQVGREPCERGLLGLVVGSSPDGSLGGSCGETDAPFAVVNCGLVLEILSLSQFARSPAKTGRHADVEGRCGGRRAAPPVCKRTADIGDRCTGGIDGVRPGRELGSEPVEGGGEVDVFP